MSFPATQRFRVRSEVLARAVDGETVVLDLSSGKYFGLKEVGTRVWGCMEAGASIDEMVARVATEFDVDGERASRDIHALIDDLLRRDLIVLAG